MKTYPLLWIPITVVLLLTFTSCEKKIDEESKTLISQFDSDKLVVSTATSVMATGLNGVFDELIADSTDQVLLFRNFLDPIRYFEDFTGYFFAQDFWGGNIAHPLNPEFVGQNQWNLTDAQGDFFIRSMTETAKGTGKGFVEYYWPNPITNIEEKKITYVHALSDFDYFIGSGFNIRPDNQKITIEQSNLDIVKGLTTCTALGFGLIFEDYTEVEKRQQFLKAFNDPIKFYDDQSGYFFIFQNDGYCLAHGFNKELEDTNIYNIQDIHGTYFIQEMSKIAQEGGGLSEYFWTNPATNAIEKKVSFVHPIPGTNIWVGAGVYGQ